MSLFKEISEIIEGGKVTITVMQKNGIQSVMIIPEGIKGIIGRSATGTPEEMDADLINVFKQPVEKVQGLKTSVVNNSDDDEDDEKSPAPKESKKAAASPAKKPEQKKKAETVAAPNLLEGIE